MDYEGRAALEFFVGLTLYALSEIGHWHRRKIWHEEE
jgi:hypothetical protein